MISSEDLFEQNFAAVDRYFLWITRAYSAANRYFYSQTKIPMGELVSKADFEVKLKSKFQEVIPDSLGGFKVSISKV